MAGNTKGRYEAWIASEQDLKTMLRQFGSATVFVDRDFAEACEPKERIKPRRVTIIVHRPRFSEEALLRRQRARARKLNGKKAATRKAVNGS